MTDPDALWPVRLRLSDVQRRTAALELEADDGRRVAIARALDLLALACFTARVEVRPWLDGLEITACWDADFTQTCGVSLDPFKTTVSGEFIVRAVPEGSPAAGAPASEITVDPNAEDPPDLLEGEEVDVGAYLVEHLALEVDPFPRKPGAEFEPPPSEDPASPFAVLKVLKPEPPKE
ncbi:DUF177 domain-containing protein [Caulobacter sp. S45]|uniref:YceD family protein n=1 Tax=Caulobacter sp. S45 TaxID=1641861 RepID=UPI001575F40B|nr:DUF177 domain-containing protein [Caulobacter sp. S45]